MAPVVGDPFTIKKCVGPTIGRGVDHYMAARPWSDTVGGKVERAGGVQAGCDRFGIPIPS